MHRLTPLFVISALAACGDNNHGPPDAAVVDGAVDAVPDAVPCIPVTDRPIVESVTSGDLVFSAADRDITFDVAAPLDRTILLTSVRAYESSPANGDVLCELTATNIACARQAPGTDNPASDGVVQVRWTLVTFTSGVSVQRGKVDTALTNNNPAVVTLSPAVDLGSSFVLLGGTRASGGGWGNNEFTRARLVNATTLEIRHATAGSLASWQVVTMLGASTQRGTTTLSTTETQKTVSIMPIAAGGVVLSTYTTDNPSSFAAAALLLQATLTNGNSIKFERDVMGTNLDVAWEVVTLPFATTQITTDFAAGATTKTEAVPNLAAATGVAISTSQSILGQSTGSTSYVGTDIDLIGESSATLTTSAGMVTLERRASNASASITWNAIDFTKDRCAAM